MFLFLCMPLSNSSLHEFNSSSNSSHHITTLLTLHLSVVAFETLTNDNALCYFVAPSRIADQLLFCLLKLLKFNNRWLIYLLYENSAFFSTLFANIVL